METFAKTIVVGFDFSPQARHALMTALHFARAQGAAVRVVTALPGHLDAGFLRKTWAEAKHQRDELYADEAVFDAVVEKMREEVTALGGEGVEVHAEASHERADRALCEQADVYTGDLIVVGATGQSALQRILVGSTASRIVRRSAWPVLVVKPEQTWPPRSVVCPVDYSDAAARALVWAARMARQTEDGHVHVLHVVETAAAQTMDLYGVGASTELESHRAQAREEAWPRLRDFCAEAGLDEDVAWTPHVVSGDVDAQVVTLAREVNADLISMGSVGRKGLEGLFIGNTAERVLRQLPCSLLITKPDAFVLNSPT